LENANFRDLKKAQGRRPMEDGRPLGYVDLVDYDDWVD